MSLEILPIGGFQEVGKNMCAIKVDDEVIIFDMGLHLPNYIALTNNDDLEIISLEKLRKGKAIPDDSMLKDWKNKVKAIVPSHAHLDHVGAIPWMAKEYDCPIIGTPFTIAVMKKIIRDEKIIFSNKIKVVEPNATIIVSKKMKLEFIHMTHSTQQTSMLALHTPYGIILYADDFKLDNTPLLGDKPNYEALKRIGKEGVKVAIINCLYAEHDTKTPSENVAKEQLEDVLLGENTKGKAIIVTTFSSHIARLQSIIHCAKKLKRKVVFCGRSLAKYVEAAEDVGIIKFSDQVEVCAYGDQMRKKLKKISEEGPEKYLIVCTGHQGEPKAVLSKIAKKQYDFHLKENDMVVFSCKTIPTEINEAQRNILEETLKDSAVAIFKDVHVSGHACQEDIKELLNLVKPEHIIPFHGVPQMSKALKQIGVERGYDEKHIHILKNGELFELKEEKK